MAVTIGACHPSIQPPPSDIDGSGLPASAASSQRRLNTVGLLSGGGDLSADRTLVVNVASSADVTAGLRNDAAVTPASLAGSLGGKAARGRTRITDVDYQALAADVYIGVSSLTAPRTITLPAASAFPSGQALFVADESGACSSTLLITIAAAGSDTIAGSPSISMGSAYQKLTFHSNGSNLWTVA